MSIDKVPNLLSPQKLVLNLLHNGLGHLLFVAELQRLAKSVQALIAVLQVGFGLAHHEEGLAIGDEGLDILVVHFNGVHGVLVLELVLLNHFVALGAVVEVDRVRVVYFLQALARAGHLQLPGHRLLWLRGTSFLCTASFPFPSATQTPLF